MTATPYIQQSEAPVDPHPDAILAGARAAERYRYRHLFKPVKLSGMQTTGPQDCEVMDAVTGQPVFTGQQIDCMWYLANSAFAARVAAMWQLISTAPKD